MMIHTYHALWIHAVWATKNREGFISKEIESEIHKIISDQLTNQGCKVRIINGMPDHVHCLFLLSPEKNVIEVMKQVKGSTSHYINQQKLTEDKFAWQRGYAAFTVAVQGFEILVNYIKNQKEHHLSRNYHQELNSFLKINGFDPI